MKDYRGQADFNKLVDGIASNETDKLLNRFRGTGINLLVCNSFIEELKRIQITPVQNWVSLGVSVITAIVAAFGISHSESAISSVISIATLAVIGFWIPYQVIPKHDNANYLKALYIYQRELMMEEEEQ